MVKAPCQVLILLLALAPPAAFSQDTQLRESCDLSITGGDGDRASFLAFDRDLRTALANQDPAAMALLTTFPLRVNEKESGTIALRNPAALQARFAEVFPEPVREAVLKQGLKTIFCSSSGIMYGAGAVWVGPRGRGWGVFTINLGTARKEEKSDSLQKLAVACSTEKQRIIVDSGEDGQALCEESAFREARARSSPQDAIFVAQRRKPWETEQRPIPNDLAPPGLARRSRTAHRR